MKAVFALLLALGCVGSVAMPDCAAAQSCCKTCRKGKACGDSCIARDKVCTKPKGCACDG